MDRAGRKLSPSSHCHLSSHPTTTCSEGPQPKCNNNDNKEKQENRNRNNKNTVLITKTQPSTKQGFVLLIRPSGPISELLDREEPATKQPDQELRARKTPTSAVYMQRCFSETLRDTSEDNTLESAFSEQLAISSRLSTTTPDVMCDFEVDHRAVGDRITKTVGPTCVSALEILNVYWHPISYNERDLLDSDMSLDSDAPIAGNENNQNNEKGPGNEIKGDQVQYTVTCTESETTTATSERLGSNACVSQASNEDRSPDEILSHIRELGKLLIGTSVGNTSNNNNNLNSNCAPQNYQPTCYGGTSKTNFPMMISSIQSFSSYSKQQDQKVKCLVFSLVAAGLDLTFFC